MLEMKNFKAFTLAEVLITLGIIGVVASLTMPSVISNQNEKKTVTRVKKAYSTLQQAYLRAEQDFGTPDGWEATGMYNSTSHILTARKFIPYLNVVKDCTGLNMTEVVKSCTKDYADTASYASIKIADGTTVIFRRWNAQCNWRYGSTPALQSVCGTVIVDINATNKPNISGKDIFTFYLTKQGLYPVGTTFDSLSVSRYCNSSREFGQAYGDYTNGTACTAWVLYRENLDYLHCEVDWNNGNKSCKEN